MLVFSDRPVIGSGLVELVPREWHPTASWHVDLDSFGGALGDRSAFAIVDAGALAADVAIELAVAAAVPYLLLLDRRDARIAPATLLAASAILLTDELDGQILELAITAVLRGLRLFPEGILPTVAAPRADGRQSADRMDVALALVARGYRDADIAAELNLSESAARKLVQRAVTRLGARTRCQAIVKAIDRGDLE
jgi:DNA-binding NarL/FixJ family response regulator